MAAQELDEYLACGNIRGSVNFPAVSIPRSEKPRVCVMHKNIPNMLSQITSAFSADNINIENMANGSKGEVAYTIVETDRPADENLIKNLSAIGGVFGIKTFA
jgi:D-3-phosphoglycerate dehydrogenase